MVISGRDEQQIGDAENFGSVGAIVSRDEKSFIVRQLRPQVSYIFQIQAIGRDSESFQSYGPLSSLEFVINELDQSASSRKMQASTQEYDLTNLGQQLAYNKEPMRRCISSC